MTKQPKGPRNNPPPAPHQDDGKEHKCYISGNVGVIGQIEANLPTDLVEEYKASNRQTDTREKGRERREGWRFLVETITLIFVVFVAFLGVVQSRQAIRTADAAAEANRLSKANFWSDQRPYIGTRLVEPFPTIGHDIHDLPLGYFDYKDFGKGPALHVKIATWVFTGENRVSDVNAWFYRLGTAPLSEAINKVFAFDGEPQTQGLPENIEMPNQEIRAMSLGFNSYPDGWDGNGIIAGRIEYLDIGGNRYWTDTCRDIVRNVPEAPDGEVAARCSNHNDVH